MSTFVRTAVDVDLTQLISASLFWCVYVSSCRHRAPKKQRSKEKQTSLPAGWKFWKNLCLDRRAETVA